MARNGYILNIYFIRFIYLTNRIIHTTFKLKLGQNLLKLQVFANTIKMCDIILKPYGISVTDILTRTDEKLCENALYAFLGIVAIQVL